MRRILKQTEPPLLTQEREDGNSFAGLRKSTRQAIQKQLCEEQGYLCCFCESAIEPDGSVMKIAHFVPQSQDKTKKLTWSNLFAACYGNEPLPANPEGEPNPIVRDQSQDPALHCDARQGQRVIDDRLRPDSIVEGLILFRPDGSVYCVEQALTKEVEAKLNLNHPRLKKNRVASLDALIFAATELRQPVEGLIARIPDASGRLSPYLSYLLAMVS